MSKKKPGLAFVSCISLACNSKVVATTRRRSYIGQLLTTADRCKRWMCCNLASKAFGFSVSRGSDLDYIVFYGFRLDRPTINILAPKNDLLEVSKISLDMSPNSFGNRSLRQRPLLPPPWTVLQRLTNLTESTLPFLTWMDITPQQWLGRKTAIKTI